MLASYLVCECECRKTILCEELMFHCVQLQYGLDWARVACGRTSTQLELIHRARDFVQSLRQRQTLAQ